MNTHIKYSQKVANNDKKNKVDFIKTVVGFVTFIIVFVVIIPFVLVKNDLYTILEAYMPNLDIIATVITWHGGPFNIWEHLYPISPLTIYGFSSQTMINYMALLGLTYIVSRETKKTNSIIKGWSLAFVMLLMTYLLPGKFILWAMDKTSQLLNYPMVDGTVTFMVGIFITILVILLESYVIKHFRGNLANFAKKIINLPKLLKK
uniref:Uncharacterized protein n=1 Tax=viral metagenome TaxID=1070528 RepID=A0A6C0C391_9ZZZZ